MNTAATLDRALDRVRAAVEPHGMLLRGGFHPGADDGVPISKSAGPGSDGLKSARTVLLIGNAGGAMWEAFCRHRRSNQEDEPNPLDSWTRRILIAVADTLSGDGTRVETLFPFGGPPYLPFQRWAMKAEGLRQSPMGPLMHPEFGLWHAYRGALVFPATLDLLDLAAVTPAETHACDTCTDKPCLTACPVGAITDGNYHVPTCIAHLRLDENGPCLTGGCQARRACPVAAEYVYGADQVRFHMQSFLQARRDDQKENRP